MDQSFTFITYFSTTITRSHNRDNLPFLTHVPGLSSSLLGSHVKSGPHIPNTSPRLRPMAPHPIGG